MPTRYNNAHKFQEHDENCTVCQEQETRPAQRGWPPKRKRGKRTLGKPVTSEALQSSTVTVNSNTNTFHNELFRLPLSSIPFNWSITKNADTFILTKANSSPCRISTSIEVSSTGNYTVCIPNRQLPENHELYSTRTRIIISLQQLLQILDDIEQFSVCNGNPDPAFVDMFDNVEPLSNKLG